MDPPPRRPGARRFLRPTRTRALQLQPQPELPEEKQEDVVPGEIDFHPPERRLGNFDEVDEIVARLTTILSSERNFYVSGTYRFEGWSLRKVYSVHDEEDIATLSCSNQLLAEFIRVNFDFTRFDLEVEPRPKISVKTRSETCSIYISGMDESLGLSITNEEFETCLNLIQRYQNIAILDVNLELTATQLSMLDERFSRPLATSGKTLTLQSVKTRPWFTRNRIPQFHLILGGYAGHNRTQMRLSEGEYDSYVQAVAAKPAMSTVLLSENLSRIDMYYDENNLCLFDEMGKQGMDFFSKYGRDIQVSCSQSQGALASQMFLRQNVKRVVIYNDSLTRLIGMFSRESVVIAEDLQTFPNFLQDFTVVLQECLKAPKYLFLGPLFYKETTVRPISYLANSKLNEVVIGQVPITQSQNLGIPPCKHLILAGPTKVSVPIGLFQHTNRIDVASAFHPRSSGWTHMTVAPVVREEEEEVEVDDEKIIYYPHLTLKSTPFPTYDALNGLEGLRRDERSRLTFESDGRITSDTIGLVPKEVLHPKVLFSGTEETYM